MLMVKDTPSTKVQLLWQIMSTQLGNHSGHNSDGLISLFNRPGVAGAVQHLGH